MRIGAHAITWVAAGPLALPAVARPLPDAVEASVVAPPEVIEAWRRVRPIGVDHGGDPSQARVLASADTLAAIEAEGWVVRRSHAPPPPVSGYTLPEAGGARLRELALAAGPRGGHAVLGWSVEGRPIDAIWLGLPPESGAPVHRVLAAHHGDEWSSFEVALATAQALVDGDGADPITTAALDASTVWIAPYVNPDGVVARSRWNARSVDLNRNYDFAWSDQEFMPGPEPFSEPETRAIRAFGHWVQPTLGLSLHSGATNYGWPWNYVEEPAEDAAELEGQAIRYQQRCGDPDLWITHGAAWYLTHGDTNDWSYGRHGVWDNTVELTQEKTPPGEAIDAYVSAHLPAMLELLTTPPDVSGAVVDAETGAPVDAEVSLWRGEEAVGRAFRTEPGTGAFHRLASDPPDAVGAAAAGYRPARVPIGAHDPIRLVPDALDGRPALPIPASDPHVELPARVSGVVRLSQPGHPDRLTVAHGGVIAAGALAGGAWTVERPDGVVHRHAVLVSDATRYRLDSVARDGDRLVVDGAGFAAGARAWSLSGSERARRPLPVLERSGERLVLDARSLPAAGRVDLWILSGGEHAFTGDIDGTEPRTWGMLESDDRGEPASCACSVKTGHLPGHAASWILAVLLWLQRRTP